MRKFSPNLRLHIKETDWLLLFFSIIASACGIILVHSATMYKLTEGHAILRDTIVMAAVVIIGIVAAIILSFIDYEIFFRFWPVIAILCLGMMSLLFIWGVGPDARSDARTWLPIRLPGFKLFIQPSEFLKIGFAITFAKHLAAVEDDLNDFRNIVLLGIHALIPFGLVVVTGDLGSALVFLAVIIGMLFLAGVKIWYLLGALLIGLSAAPILWFKFLSDFQKQRILAVYYPSALSESKFKEVIYQQQQAVNAIGSGQLTGKGLFHGQYTQNGLVPVNESDMIFSVVGEELGFIGCVAILALLAVIIVKIVNVGRRAPDKHTQLFCYGIALTIAVQSIINIGVCIKLLPVIGITLPFLSSGGSSNLCVYLAIGLVMSVYRYNRERDPINYRLTGITTPFNRI
ncbi:MAG: FtsW/RodA/SpoVE family cell cycle protein [Clostridiales bacterium]|nr:FtsW/RodA/SpoVE family cell cycle protein [Clostridiales bacterium]